MAAIWTILKLVGGFFSSYRIYFILAGLLAALTTVFVYIGNHAQMKVQVKNFAQTIQSQQATIKSCNQALKQRNERIAMMNKSQIEALEVAAKRIKEAEDAAREVNQQHDIMSAELADARFRTLENIRDDENYADWAYGDVHVRGWEQLRDAAEGSPD